MSIRIVIADDHALVRSGLRALLETQPDLEVVGEAEDGVTVVERCRTLGPDVVLLDLAMAGRSGIAAAEELRDQCPRTRVVVLTMHEDEGYARLARGAGVAGYVVKRALATELLQAIRAVHRGERYVTAALRSVFEEADARLASVTGHAGVLTVREREVIGLLALGHTNGEIASKLHISEKTAESHRAHIMEKLGLKTRADLVRYALEHGLFQP